MTLFTDIRNQKPAVRFVLFALSSFLVISLIGVVWFSSVRRELVAAVNDDPAVLEELDANAPDPLAAIGRVVSTITASIGSLIGIDPDAGLTEQGFDRNGRNENTGGVHLLPLSE